MLRSLILLWCGLSTGVTHLAAQYQPEQSPRQQRPPTDVNANLTEQFRQLEQEFGGAILHKDAGALERLVGPEYALRIADVPQSSLPHAIWMDNSLHRLKPESVEQRHHAVRKLADDLAVVSVVWTTKASTEGRDFSGDFYIVVSTAGGPDLLEASPHN